MKLVFTLNMKYFLKVTNLILRLELLLEWEHGLHSITLLMRSQIVTSDTSLDLASFEKVA